MTKLTQLPPRPSPCDFDCAEQPAAQLNGNCFCAGPEVDALADALRAAPDAPDVAALVAERCPHLFSSLPVFMSAEQAAQIRELIGAIESVIVLPAWQEAVLASAPAIARHDPGARGVFFGYDFHLGADSVALIEINTNAGGALINAALARAQQPCAMLGHDAGQGARQASAFEHAIVAMFREEYRLGGPAPALSRVAIVDSRPQDQYLYPEFLLFARLFRDAGIDAVICDPSELAYRDGRLWHGELAIDLVYNRLTDFAFDEPDSAALRAAYLERTAVVTPHPRAHALYADKRNLAILTDPARLAALGVDEATTAILMRGIPHTEVVRAADADALWERRRQLFFKPFGGFGGRAAYRGDKVTKRVWEEILAGDYVAQALVAPSERVMGPDSGEADLKAQTRKFDIRSYCYHGVVQWTAARVYQGQTTNFRTPGGGFAVVYEV